MKNSRNSYINMIIIFAGVIIGGILGLFLVRLLNFPEWSPYAMMVIFPSLISLLASRFNERNER